MFRFETDGASVPLVNRLINPGVTLPTRITALTGIRPDDLVATGGDPAEVLSATHAEIVALVEGGVPIVIYNAMYDWPLLAAELARHRLAALPDVPPAILIDPLVLDRHVDRYRKGKRTLAAVAAHYGVSLDGSHRAAGDAAATVAVARQIGGAYPELHLDGPDIHTLQVDAHNRWQASFNEYLVETASARPLLTGVWPTGCDASQG